MIKLKCFICIQSFQLSQHRLYQCHLLPPSPLPPSPLPPPRRITGPTTFVLGTNTRESPRLIFIPSIITTRNAKNTPNCTMPTLWFFVKMSPRSLVGIGARVGLLRTAPTTTDTWISAPERNTRYTEKRTRSSRKSVSKQARHTRVSE